MRTAADPPTLKIEPLDLPRAGLPGLMAAMVRPPLEALLAFPALNALYRRVGRHQTPQAFCGAVLEALDLTLRVSTTDFHRIPKRGPLLVVANHPFGGIEGLLLAEMLGRARPDVKIMANHLLGRIPDLAELFIFVDVFDRPDSRGRNLRGLKQTMGWLKRGGVLGVFPAGEVAHLQLDAGRVTDPAWSPHVAALARRMRAAVLPVFFTGSNGPVFQVAGLVAGPLRTAMLPHEFLNKRHRTLEAFIGSPIGPEQLDRFDDEAAAIEYLRLRTFALAGRRRPGGAARSARSAIPELVRRARRPPTAPVAPPADPDTLQREIDALGPDAPLAESGDIAVYLGRAPQMPNLLHEIGRLRETTFRAIGEGTDRPLDLDEYDRYYRHLILWQRKRRELIGSYRLGLTDRIRRRRGRRGLYLHSLFRFPDELLERLGPAVELGRSFVRPEYQKSFSALMLLWRGIGRFLAREGRYRHLIGPVSISSRYRLASRSLMVRFLTRPRFRSPLARLVTPRYPFRPNRRLDADLLLLAARMQSIDELDAVVQDIEPGVGIPILLRQYLKLGARVLQFNVDPAFGYCLDAFCVLDVLDAEPRTTRKYIGPEPYETLMRSLNGG